MLMVCANSKGLFKMGLNNLIQPTRPTVAGLVEKLRTKDLYVDNSFQRRLVWTEKQKIRLIETILIGFPMPEIYLWQQPADVDTGKQKQSIVDGQQRLTTLAQFVSNEWPLREASLDFSEAEYASSYWRDLDSPLKQRFWDYVITARTIPSDVTSEQITSIFRRLNETDRSLNPQELRNAEFNGAFIKAAEEVANLEGFGRLDMFTDSQIRRMLDIQFASSMLIFLRRGMIEESLSNINETYDMYNDDYPQANADITELGRFFNDLDSLYFSNDRVKAFFSRQVHLFTLFCLDQSLSERKVDKSTVGIKLGAFVEAYESSESAGDLVEKYKEGASSRTRSRSSRSARLSALSKWVLAEQ